MLLVIDLIWQDPFFDTLAERREDITIVDCANYVPTTHEQVFNDRLLHSRERVLEDGTVERELVECWNHPVRILRDICVGEYGMQAQGTCGGWLFTLLCFTSSKPILSHSFKYTEAQDAILRQTFFANRCPFAASGSFHSSSETRQQYLDAVAQTDSLMRPFFNWLFNVFLPNADRAIAFGAPAYEQIVLGGGALHAGWAGEALTNHVFRDQQESLHHMVQIGAGWVPEDGASNVVRTLGHIAADIALQSWHEIEDPTIYLTPARTRDPNQPASDTTLSQITGLVQMCDGTFVDRELADFFEAESPGFFNTQTINQTPVTHHHAVGSLLSVRAALARNDGQLVGPWLCNECGDNYGGPHDYNSRCRECDTSAARFCHPSQVNRVDPLIRGFCEYCNNSGQYNMRHVCPNHPSANNPYYTLAVPNDDFVYEASENPTILVRGQNLLTGSYDRSYTQLEGGLVDVIRNEAVTLLDRYATRIAARITSDTLEAGLEYAARVGLERFVFSRQRGGAIGAVRPILQPLVIVGVKGLVKTLKRLLHVSSNNGLQDGSFEFNGYRYEGVPIPVMEAADDDNV